MNPLKDPHQPTGYVGIHCSHCGAWLAWCNPPAPPVPVLGRCCQWPTDGGLS
jgi:hypothetical protein